MKVALIVTLVLAVSLAPTEAFGWGGWGGGWGYGGMGWGGMGWGGMGWGGMGWGGYGMGLWGKRDAGESPTETTNVPEVILNRTECLYNIDEELLRCKSPIGRTQCETELRWELEDSEMSFGIALFEDLTENRFRLIGRKLDNSGWFSGVWMSEREGIPSYPSLFTGETSQLKGLRIKEEKCYAEIAEILKGSNRRERVMVGEELKPVVVVGDIMTLATPEKDSERVERLIETVEGLEEELVTVKRERDSERVERLTEMVEGLGEELLTMKREMTKMSKRF